MRGARDDVGRLESARLPEFRENLVRFLERLLAPDIKPGALDLMGLHRLARVEPLDKSPRLIRIVSRRE